jgi:hypothetical protein
LFAAALLAAASAGAYEPRLNRIEPQGGQRGTEIQVDFFGGRIGVEPQEVVLYESGLEVQGLKRVDDNRVSAKVQIRPDCPLGRHALRLRTTSGISELMTFHVGALPEQDEAEPNNQVEEANAVPLGVTIRGVVKREDIDLFAVEANQGARLSVEVEGLRMGRTFFDPAIELLDESGKVLAECDDAAAAHQDAFLSFVAPKTGRYYVKLRESALQGEDLATYRLHIGKFPRPAAVYPPAGARGAEVTLQWIGDASGAFEQQVKLPAEGDKHLAWAEDARGVAPSAVEIQLLEKPPTLEVEPNGKRDQAAAIEAPGHAVGVIQEPGDQDHFRFSSKKGQVWDLRVRARNLRSPVDSVLRVFDSKGKNLAGNDDDRGYPDSYIRFTAPEDGEYTLQVEDRLKRGQEDFVYLLEVGRPAPRAEVSIEERRRYEATPIEVPQGGKTAVLLTLARRDVGGEMKIDFEGLPEGVTAEVFPLAGNYNRVPVVFSAAPEAPLASALCPIKAGLVDGKREVLTQFSQQTWFARGRNNKPMWSHFADRAPVVVTGPLPFRLRIETPKAPIVRDGVKNLKIIADRDEGFNESIRIYTLYNPPGVSSNRSLSIVKGKSEASIPTTANGNAQTGDWNITVVGEINSGGRVYAATPFTTLTVAERYFDMKVPSVNAKQGESVGLTVELSQRTPFDGEAELKLVRLPPGVTAEPVQVNKEASAATFALAIATDAKVGRHRGLGTQATLSVNGEPVICTQGYSEVRVDPKESPPEATAKSDKKAPGEKS